MNSNLQENIIEMMNVQPEINPKDEIRRSIDFMKEYLYKHDFLKSYVLGISGGQDSTLLGKLAQMTMEEMRQETDDDDYQFIALRLPYGEQFDEDDASDAIKWIGADQNYDIDIKPGVDAQVEDIEKTGIEISDFNKGNMKARQRMIVHYAIAGETNGIVLGTDHPAENITGYFTKYGDGGVDIIPLFRLNKRQGVQLLKELDAPEKFYEKVPTADLVDGQPGLSDEKQLGVSYSAIDDYLEGKEVSEKEEKIIEGWFMSSQHKRHLPVTIFDDFWK